MTTVAYEKSNNKRTHNPICENLTTMASRNFVTKHHKHCHLQGHHKWHHSLCYWITIWIILVWMPYPVLPDVIYRVDPLALLAATLRTYQRAGCDSEQLSLSCPRGTSISIELAQYGRAGDSSDHSLCPPISQKLLTTTDSVGDGVIHSGTEIEIKPPETCTVSGLQYTLLQTVVDACQKKRHCKFSANSKNLNNPDPCSGIRKFVEIAYKCRPYEFRSKVACENDNMPLVCNPYSRIAIYSASFGHIERETAQCGPNNAMPDTLENKQTCVVSYATETVMQICHGRRRCSVMADAGTFGRPCKNDVRMYLKVVYTCIPRKVLKDRYETPPETDEPKQSDMDLDHDELYDEDQFYRESEAIPPAPKLQGAIPNPSLPFDFNLDNDGHPLSTDYPPLFANNDSSLEDNETIFETALNEYDGMNYFYRQKCENQDEWGPIGLNCTEKDLIKERIKVIGFVSNWIEAFVHIRKNQEQFYLYLIISVAAGMLLCLTLVIGRLALQRRRSSCRKSGSSNDSHSGKVCNDPISGVVVGVKIDADHQTQSSLTSTNHPKNFRDDISDSDGDIDLTAPIAVSSLSSRNETYLTYAPTGSCSYTTGNMMEAHSEAQPISLSSATTVFMPTPSATLASYQSGLLANGNGTYTTAKTLSGSAGGAINRQTPPPALQQNHFTGIGGSICSPTVSGAMTMGPHVLAASALDSSQLSAGVGPYMTGTVLFPGHNHAHIGTLRRGYLPTSMGVFKPAHLPLVNNTRIPHSLAVVPTSSNSMYYDCTIPRNINRDITGENTQCFYG